MSTDKKTLRHQYLAERRTVDKDALNDLISLQFKNWLGQQSTYYHIGSYQPIKKFNELNLKSIEKSIQKNNNSSQIYYPKIEENTMSFIKNDTDSIWKINNWGINEIDNGKIINPQTLDLVICPLLICDLKGYRLGYGKGFYDKYLTQVSQTCIKIGLGYFEPIESISDINETDIPLDVYISPQKIYYFN